ncbi:MAG TPA: epoxide hydrolase [Propionibacteriaceae bacterium]|jgi:pimeloyl-ACP methyl ester carboxylesterase|nr:epoxide hydrolase [Propionibacteriaceae bacterium]
MSSAPWPVHESVLIDLKERLRGFRHVPLVEGVGWSRGTDPGYLSELVDYWAETYYWREHEERILDYPWVHTGAPGAGLRSIHRVAGADAPTVVLLHGWPDSVLRFERVLPLLTDVNVVVPALPGFPYADPVTRPGMSTSAMADAVAGSLSELGYDRYVVSGGDVGSAVAEAMGAQHRNHVAALHLTDVPYTHLFTVDPGELSEAEEKYLSDGQGWQFAEGAYALMQSTKPHTLAVALGDSPAGLAAWIVEKLRSWSDCGGDLESVFSREDLLTWLTAYWVTGTIGSSFVPYVEDAPPIEGKVDIPTVVTIFPHDLVPAPREFGERFFDIRVWDEEPSGGHFGAWEKPEEFVAGLRKAIALV